MFGFDMKAIAEQLKAFQDQSERLVNAVESIQNDIALIKKTMGIEQPAIFNDHVQALCVSETEEHKQRVGDMHSDMMQKLGFTAQPGLYDETNTTNKAGE